ncbi:hypothetical protein D3C81_1556820 [compost metagenome]
MRAHQLHAGLSVGMANQGDVADVFFEAVEVETEHAEQRVVGIDTPELLLPVGDADQCELAAGFAERSDVGIPAQWLGVMQVEHRTFG